MASILIRIKYLLYGADYKLLLENLIDSEPSAKAIKENYKADFLKYLKSPMVLLATALAPLLFIPGFAGMIPAITIIAVSIAGKYSAAQHESSCRNRLLSSLPLQIEQLLMVVQSGMDIIPAINIVSEITDSREIEDKRKPGFHEKSLISTLKQAVKSAEAGELFEKALKKQAEDNPLLPLRYAMLHLANSHIDGSEIKAALTELAESSQQSYQEHINKIISALPAKAVVPLVLTFAGLLIGFLTSPILKILKLTSSTSLT